LILWFMLLQLEVKNILIGSKNKLAWMLEMIDLNLRKKPMPSLILEHQTK